jgi:hypothetical protein
MILVVLVVAAVVAFVAFIFSLMKRTDAYREAYTRASNDPRVVESLGTPIETGWWVSGKVKVESDGGGTAKLNFPISGPKGSGRVRASASRENGTWSYSWLIVKPAGRGEIDLLHR